ncbi:unknown [Candidatus Apopatosoma intestinale]|nr:unknown [Candidatus Apopatosoma intestinale]
MGIVKGAVFTDEIINGTTYKVISCASEGGTYKIVNPAVQIAMLEPWGVRVSAAVTKDGAAISPDDYATENIRCGVWFAIGEEKYASAEEIKNAAGSEYISGKADTEGFFCDYRGIYIYDFDKYISIAIELDSGDEKLYSKTISYSMLELIEMRLGADDCLGAENDLLKYMVDYHMYVDAYSKGN